MPDREPQIHPQQTRTSHDRLASDVVAAGVVSARSPERYDPAIAQRLRHGLLRRPLGSDAPLRW